MPDQSDTPAHLRQLPQEDVARVVATIRSNVPHMPHTLQLELRAFAETRTVHDGRRLANALRYYEGKTGLAKEVEDILPAPGGVLADLNDGRGRR